MRGRSKRFRRGALAGAALLLCPFLFLMKTDPALAEEANYTYKVTFYPGGHASFQSKGQLTVEENLKDPSGSGSPADGAAPVIELAADGSAITVTGLEAGDRVSFSGVENAVNMEQGSRYYVKGIRASGRDNNTVSSSAFTVEEDMDYVVAYGIKGEQVSYVVSYRDMEGKDLAPDDTYQGKVGDKPRVAYRYIEGYQPQTYNLTKTLSKNNAENVFVFLYRKVSAKANGSDSGDEKAAVFVSSGEAINDRSQDSPDQDAGSGEGGVQSSGGHREEEIENPGGNQEDEAKNPNEGNDGPSEEEDLDNPGTPLGGLEEDEKARGGAAGYQFSMEISICMALAGGAAVAAALWIMLMRKMKAK